MAGDLPAVQKSFFRNLVAFIIALAMMVRHKETFQVEKGNWKFMLLRAIFGTLGILCNFYAVDHLVLSDASMLNKMSPFFVILFSFLILKEKLTPIQVTAVCGAFIGSLFIIKPTFLNMNLMPSLIGLCGGLCAGIAYTMVRVLGQRGQKGVSVVLFFSGFSCLVTLPVLIVKLSYNDYVAGNCSSGSRSGCGRRTVRHYSSLLSCTGERNLRLRLFSDHIFCDHWFLLFHQIPDRFSVLGYVIIIGMAVWMFFYNQRHDAAEIK